MMHLLHGRTIGHIDRYFGGARDAATVRGAMRRVGRCDACRDRYERHLLFERVRPADTAPAGDRLWQSIEASAAARQASAAAVVPAPRVTPARAGLLVAAFAGVALLAAPVLRTRHDTAGEGAFVARGGAPDAAVTPALHLYRNLGGQALAVTGTVRAGDGLLVAYSNPSDLAYLMVFAVDVNGGVHWYYPAYERLGDDPAAVSIRARTLGVELGEEIRHVLPAGAMKMVALFTPQPRHVLEVERAVGAALARPGAGAEPLAGLAGPDGHTLVVPLEVTP
jgi:hypothetical protein